jgi:acid stress chaperone HdeB
VQKIRRGEGFLGQGENVMKFVAGPLVAGMLICCNSAFASQIDLSTWTCQKFQAASKDDVGVILAWLDGYYKNENDPPIIDTDKFVANAKKLGEFCSAHPDTGLITATDELFQTKKK